MRVADSRGTRGFDLYRTRRHAQLSQRSPTLAWSPDDCDLLVGSADGQESLLWLMRT